MVVLHYTAMASARAALERLCDPAAEVSAHYLVGRCGTVWQMVDEARRAWHAGAGTWGGQDDINSRSIGIELDNTGTCPFTEPLMTALEDLLAGILKRHAIPPQSVIGHSDMAPARKMDPGPRFDWRRLACRGASVWPAPEDGAPAGDFHREAIRFGYDAALPPDLRLAAFRLRFRPWATGPVQTADAAAITDLARRFAVDGRSGAA